MRTLLQILSHPPGSRQGVADYALHLGRELRSQHGIETIYAVPHVAGSSVEQFRIVSLDAALENSVDAVLLHYVNYGFHPRGIPSSLPDTIERVLGQRAALPLVTLFHELYASGQPWQSAFWLQPWQKKIARRLALMSRSCLSSNPVARDELARLAPGARAEVQPVPSNLGESNLARAELEKRDPHCWIICGSPPLLRRSLTSFLRSRKGIPPEYHPDRVIVFGGRDDAEIRNQLQALTTSKIEYYAELGPPEASAVLRQAAFGWLDYFSAPHPRAEVLWKSGIFAAMCAHGVLPVSPYPLEEGTNDRRLPEVPWVSEAESSIPPGEARIERAARFHDWYRTHATLNHAVAAVMNALRLA